MFIEGNLRVTEEASTLAEFVKKYPGIELEAIDGKEVDGMCVVCKRPLFAYTDNYRMDGDGICICFTCDSTLAPKDNHTGLVKAIDEIGR